MILSFHPCFEADVNRICAGRGPHEGDVAAMQAAAAVILPQGCRQDLWQAAVRSCPHVFPDYHARFQYTAAKPVRFACSAAWEPNTLRRQFTGRSVR